MHKSFSFLIVALIFALSIPARADEQTMAHVYYPPNLKIIQGVKSINVFTSIDARTGGYQEWLKSIPQPTHESINNRAVQLLSKAFEAAKSPLKAQVGTSETFLKKDPKHSAYLHIIINYKSFEILGANKYLVGAIVADVKRSSTQQDTFGDYFAVTGTPVLFLLSTDKEESLKSLNGALDEAVNAVSRQILAK